MVPHLHVGSYLFEVNQLGAAWLGLFQAFGRPGTKRIACTQPALGYLIFTGQKDVVLLKETGVNQLLQNFEWVT